MINDEASYNSGQSLSNRGTIEPKLTFVQNAKECVQDLSYILFKGFSPITEDDVENDTLNRMSKKEIAMLYAPHVVFIGAGLAVVSYILYALNK